MNSHLLMAYVESPEGKIRDLLGVLVLVSLACGGFLVTLAVQLVLASLFPAQGRRLADEAGAAPWRSLAAGLALTVLLALAAAVAGRSPARPLAILPVASWFLLALAGLHLRSRLYGERLAGEAAPEAVQVAVGWFALWFASWVPFAGWVFGAWQAVTGMGGLVLGALSSGPPAPRPAAAGPEAASPA
ncbi:MAG: hypothetical protein HY722_02205 [Planctomycetes bacterium]|nr:hypothetical protein [Planctomycetota bacterium]